VPYWGATTMPARATRLGAPALVALNARYIMPLMAKPDDFLVRPDEGHLVWLAGLGARVMLDGHQTGSRFSLVEHPLKARVLGSPVHTHTQEDEYSFVLEGRIGVQIGDLEMFATAGTLVVKPRGMPHAFWNPDDAPARVLELISPAGFEAYFAALAELFASGRPDPTRGEAIRKHFGLELDVDSMQRLVAKHGLVQPV
jgi:mannose-6-phosphate isomerase-like protein (cupin superfamily)